VSWSPQATSGSFGSSLPSSGSLAFGAQVSDAVACVTSSWFAVPSAPISCGFCRSALAGWISLDVCSSTESSAGAWLDAGGDGVLLLGGAGVVLCCCAGAAAGAPPPPSAGRVCGALERAFGAPEDGGA